MKKENKNPYNTLEIIVNSEPLIIKKEGKFIAVSIESMNNKYVIAFDIINELNLENFNPNEHDYETIAVVESPIQTGGFLNFRNEMLHKLDSLSIDEFKELYY